MQPTHLVCAVRARLTFANVAAALALFVALGGTSLAAVTRESGSKVLHGCVSQRDGRLRIVSRPSRCDKRERPISFNRDGQRGAAGKAGTAGAAGARGAAGAAGPAGQTGAGGAQGATGPQGERGAQGATGSQGPVGPSVSSSAVDNTTLQYVPYLASVVGTTIDVPAGADAIVATGTVTWWNEATSSRQVSCWLLLDGSQTIDFAPTSSPRSDDERDGHVSGNLALTMRFEVDPGPHRVDVSCESAGSDARIVTRSVTLVATG
ncbi:MAG TPA: hypothetical protein VI318_10105 [Baekduia sp.]